MNSSSSVYAPQSATAVIEAGAGCALLSFPSDAARLLLGAPLDAPDALTVATSAESRWVTLAAAFWLARGDKQSRASKGMIAAMVIYNVGVVFILGAVSVAWRHVAIALWPAVVLRSAMSAWCIMIVLLVEWRRAARESPSVAITR